MREEARIRERVEFFNLNVFYLPLFLILLTILYTIIFTLARLTINLASSLNWVDEFILLSFLKAK